MSPRLQSCLTDPHVEMMNKMRTFTEDYKLYKWLCAVIHVSPRALEGLDTRIVGSYRLSRNECTSVLWYYFFILRGPCNWSRSNTK
jgi:hypothetical protein